MSLFFILILCAYVKRYHVEQRGTIVYAGDDENALEYMKLIGGGGVSARSEGLSRAAVEHS